VDTHLVITKLDEAISNKTFGGSSGAGSGMAYMAVPYQSAENWAVDSQENH